MCIYVCVYTHIIWITTYSCIVKCRWSPLLGDLSADSLEHFGRLPEMISFSRAGLHDRRARARWAAASVVHVSEAPASAS